MAKNASRTIPADTLPGIEELVEVDTVRGALQVVRRWGRKHYSTNGERFRIQLCLDRWRGATLDRTGAEALRDELDRMLRENTEPKRRPSARRTSEESK